MVLADDIARSALTSELPLGVITSLAAGPTREVLTRETVSRLYDMAVRQHDSPGFQSIFPAFVHPGFKSRVLLLTGGSGEGKTTMLEQMVAAHQELDFGGIVCPGTFKNGRRYNSRVHCLHTGASALFARREDASGNGPFRFYGEGRALADKALAPLENARRDCVVVDEVGPMELRGKGHAPLLGPLLALKKPRHIWAVRPAIVDEVRRSWMLTDPVIVKVSEPDAMDRIHRFLTQQGS